MCSKADGKKVLWADQAGAFKPTLRLTKNPLGLRLLLFSEFLGCGRG